jgi:peptidoglycan/LPS O-acetylase OafA/YrhL
MYYTLFKKPRPKAFTFITNRLTKIFFLYWVALALLFVIVPFEINSSFFKTFLLLPGHYSVLGVSWSLSYELYFYFLIGTVVYLLPNKHHKSLFLALLLTSTSITLINLTSFTLKGSILNFFVGANFWEFQLGILAGFVSTSFHLRIKSYALFALTIIAFLLLSIIAIPYGDPASYIVYGCLAFLVVTFFSRYEKENFINVRTSKGFKVLGDASYAIYLFGPIVTILITSNNTLSKLLIIVTTITISILFNRFVENNVLRWSRSIVQTRLIRRCSI